MLTVDNYIRHVSLSLGQCFSDFPFAQILTFLLDLVEFQQFCGKRKSLKLLPSIMVDLHFFGFQSVLSLSSNQVNSPYRASVIYCCFRYCFSAEAFSFDRSLSTRSMLDFHVVKFLYFILVILLASSICLTSLFFKL